MATPDFEKFLDQFNEKVLRPALEAGKQKLDEALDNLPGGSISRAVEEAYELLSSPDVSLGFGAFDTSKIADAVDGLKARLQDEQTSLQLAQGLKQIASQTSTDSLGSLISKATDGASFEQQFAAQILFAQLAPKLEELKTASVEDIAWQVRLFADNLNGADIAWQVGQLLQANSGQLKEQLDGAQGQLPPKEAVSEAAEGLFDAARETLGKAAQGATFKETLEILKQFADNANEIVNRALGGDFPQSPIVDKAPPAPKKGKKKGPGKKWDL